MEEFRLFSYIDKALIEDEARAARASLVPAVWPSEASAERLDDKLESDIEGHCHRASYLRMTGSPVTNTVDAVGAWRWVTGRMIEGHLSNLAKLSKPLIYVASGVRTYIADLYLPLEIDLVVVNPVTHSPWITECKTNYGYMSKSDLKNKGPKREHIMQLAMYLDQVKTGANLKRLIAAGLEEREKGTYARNRIEANLENLQTMGDGPVFGKLAYIARDDCERKEFTITIETDFDGFHYPAVDGQCWKIFSLESIYQRYRKLQDYWFRARREAHDRLAAKGILKPEKLQLILARETLEDATIRRAEEQIGETELAYLQQLSEEVLKLPVSFLPPAEYEWSYSQAKVEKLAAAGLIGKARYKAWKEKKPGKDRIGSWHCLYCHHKSKCVPLQNPNWAYQVYDVDNMLADMETMLAQAQEKE